MGVVKIPSGAGSVGFSTTRQLVVRLALAFLLLSAAFQYFFNVRLDPYKCKSVFHSGSWSSQDPNRPYLRWSPDNCKLREYTKGDFGDCVKGRRVVFAGDSWVRQLYWAAATRLDKTKQEIAILDFYLSENKHTDLLFEAEGLQLEFIWDPWLNSTNFRDQLGRFRQESEPPRFGTGRRDSPALLIAGTPALWAARHGEGEYMQLFRRGVDQLLPYMKEDLGSFLMSQPRLTGRSTNWLPNQLVVLPVPVPHYKRLTPARKETITPDKINAMNAYLRALPDAAQAHIPWVFVDMVEGIPPAYNEDGIHVGRDVRERAMSVILNEHCNAGLQTDMVHTATLGCISYDTPSLVQAGILLASVAATALMFMRRGEAMAMSTAVESLAPLAFAALISYVAENSHVSIKTDRLWSGAAFALLTLGFWAASFASVRNLEGGATSVVPGFIPREHSDEWKGWMQVSVLLLNYFDGDSSLFSHKVMRMIGAVYYFLSAYGHATYFLSTRDYSFRRVAAVLLRLNLLNALLTFTLASSATAYHFTPLISIWFLITYATLAFRRASNDNVALLIAKIVAAALVINLVVFPPGLARELVNLTNTLSRSAFDSSKISHLLTEDRVTPFIGVLAAALAHRAHQLRNPGDALRQRTKGPAESAIDDLILAASDGTLLRVGGIRVSYLLVANLTVFASLATLLLSDFVIHYQDTYDNLHPFLSYLPIVTGTYLRSQAPILRSSYLALPAALGEIALEAYLLHQHIWLAGRGTSILSVWSPSSPGALGKALVTAQKLCIPVVFFWLAAGCREATRAAIELVLGPTAVSAVESAEKGEKRVKIGAARTAPLGDVRIRVALFVGAIWLANLLYGW
ncbi:uncharacterized protein DNG_05491 [Cephalotrichum gorgonifer]|uniref:Cas1p 10 TM acyl transferase domain-containing protein n=1 Tax=Cephalotrichum gorgonifer TaxID=2041049 RepID=A0AAE8MY01_9PEZI|nr:uncharacterized protein DNG_05491 [Cephalotrichum gorgonifer]